MAWCVKTHFSTGPWIPGTVKELTLTECGMNLGFW